MTECEGCFVSYSPCILIAKKQDKECPCKICLVKVVCRSVLDICKEYEDLLLNCNTIGIKNE